MRRPKTVCPLILRTVFGLAACALAARSVLASTAPLQYREQKLTVEGEQRTVRIPEGFRFEVMTTELSKPRLITFAANGDLFLGSRSGSVYRLSPPYARPDVLLELSNYPHSVAFRKGEILIAQTTGLYRAPYASGQRQIARRDVTLLAKLPGGRGHTSRTVRIGPDGRVYLSLGISGNCSDQYLGEGYPFEDRRGGVLVLREEGGEPRWEPFASGLRNPVGFDWHPETGVMYATNNGPDHLGFDLPPESFSQLSAGSFHGMPWFHYDGRRIQRDPCIERPPPRPIGDVTPPVATFPARNAPMAVAFVPKGGMAPELENDAIVALRGSWATAPSGGFFGDTATRRHPKVVAVRFQEGEAKRVDDLITGFQLPDGKRWARPVGVAVGPDGALYLTSDEGAQALFRLRRTP